MATPVAVRPAAPGRAGRIALVALRAALAAVFAGAGLAKLGGSPEMVRLFADIGAGQGLRTLVGALEVAGAAGLLVPRLAGPAALGLAALMVGATVTNVVVLGVSPVLTLVLLAAAGGVAWSRRRPLRAVLRR